MAMGIPAKVAGTLAVGNLSLKLASNTIAREKPTAEANEKTTVCIKLNSSWILIMAIPKTAQLVVIKGRNMPSALYRAGIDFCKNNGGFICSIVARIGVISIT